MLLEEGRLVAPRDGLSMARIGCSGKDRKTPMRKTIPPHLQVRSIYVLIIMSAERRQFEKDGETSAA
jgi:hypothetical protein